MGFSPRIYEFMGFHWDFSSINADSNGLKNHDD